MLEALNCHRFELNVEFLYDLYHGQVINQQTYKQKMSIPVTNGGLWGDFIVMFWISIYLQHSIHVWNKSNGRIMSKLKGNEYNTEILHIIYGNNHYEPTTMHNQIANVVNV
jgi:hypothetical protein